MGCKHSTATQAAKSVVTDDTYIDDYNEEFSINQQNVNQSQILTENENNMNSFIKNSINSKTAFGNSMNNNRAGVSNGYTAKRTPNITRQPLTIIPSAQPVYRQPKPKPVPPNTKNITDLVDLEEYGLPADDTDKPQNNVAVGGYAISQNSGNFSERNNNANEISNSSRQSFVNSNISTPKVSKTTVKTVSPKTENVTHVVDLEDLDSSSAHNQINKSLSNMSIKTDNRQKQNSQVQNGHVITNNMAASKQNNVQPFTVISSNKSTYGAKRTMKSASSNTENITQIVDLEEYDL